MTKRIVYLPRYYAKECFDTEEYEEDGRWITESFPYWAIREAPEAEGENHSHEIGRATNEGWAQVIVDALNAESKRRSRKKVAA